MNRAMLALTTWLALTGVAVAQPSHLVDEATPNAAWLDVGVDYSLMVLTAGYARRLGPIELNGALTLPTAEPDFSDVRLRIGARWAWRIHGPWQVPVELGLIGRRGDNEVMTAWGLGIEPAIAPGFWGERGVAAVEVRYDATVLTHIEHSDFYREFYHPTARDGWYHTTAANTRIGLRLGWRFGDVLTSLRAGVQLAGPYNEFLPPLYAILGGGYVF